jgi:tetratricopeptide (TPR) repeat protein
MTKFGRQLLFPFCILLFSSLCAAGEETWTEVRSPNFIVIANASPKQARRTAKSFEQFRLLIQTVWSPLKVDPPTPLTIFAGKDERSYKTLIAEEQPVKGSAQSVGMFIAGPERELVALRMDVPEDLPYHVLYHEYVHMILRLNFGRLPLWLSEGLAELFANADISDKSQGIGRFSPEAAHVLKTNPRIPLSMLMSATSDSPYYRQKDKADVFYAQSWAITHYLYLGDKRAHQDKLMAFIKMIVDGVPEQDALARAFGDLKDLEESLNKYLQSTTYYLRVKSQLGMNADKFRTRTLSEVESLAARGELLVHNNKLDRAQLMLDRALYLDPRNARANEGMGYFFLRINDREKSRKYFTAAADLDSMNCLAHYFAAETAMAEEGDPEIAEKYLRAAISINPFFAPAYGKLSQLLLKNKSDLDEALEYADKGAELEPGRLSYKLNIAYIMALMDKVDEAYALGQRALSAARNDDQDRGQAESLLSWIQSLRDRKALLQGFSQKTPKEPVLVNRKEEMEAEKKRQERSAGIASLKTGSVVKLRGVIQTVQCQYPAVMDIIFDASAKQYPLHAENYLEVGYKATIPLAQIDPCKDLEGKQVDMEYLPVEGEDFSGLIRLITIIHKK